MRRKIPSTQALLAFEAAAHRGSFTLAAQDLSVSQSAVSHQVLGLELNLPKALGFAIVRLAEAFLYNDADGLRGDVDRLREVEAALLGVTRKTGTR